MVSFDINKAKSNYFNLRSHYIVQVIPLKTGNGFFMGGGVSFKEVICVLCTILPPVPWNIHQYYRVNEY